MVGDEDQSIYGFRAAFPEALLAFEREYANTKVLLMEENYRSTREIVTAANAFVSNNRYRHKKQVRPTRKSGAPIHIIHADSRMAQYHYLFNTVQKCSSETAILYRNNESALPLIDLFQRSGIPFNCKSFEDNFFTNRLVVDIIDIIHFAYHPNDEELFLRIFYKFGSPISKSAALYACDRSRKNGTTILQELVNCPELSSYGRQAAMDLHTYLTDLPNQTADTALFQIWHTLNYSVFAATNQLDGNKFDVLLILGRQEPSPMDFLHRLEELRILIQTPCDDPKIPLTLSTIHSSKGLEYDTVYLLDMFNTILPSVAREDVANQTQLLEYEEERRMFYVAMTRAKNDLFALRIADQASEFLEELCSALPKQAIDPKELFAPLQQNLCGKTYTHSDFGKGKIICHWEDDLLVQYGTGQIKLQRLSELLEQRDRRITYETPKIAPPISPSYCQKQTISPGTPITHKNFGSGIVLSVQGDIAEIRFSSQVGDKRISLSTSLKNGSLKL